MSLGRRLQRLNPVRAWMRWGEQLRARDTMASYPPEHRRRTAIVGSLMTVLTCGVFGLVLLAAGATGPFYVALFGLLLLTLLQCLRAVWRPEGFLAFGRYYAVACVVGGVLLAVATPDWNLG